MAQPLIDEGPAAVSAVLAPLNPTGAFITPEQLAAAVVYLASDAAEMINGHDLVIDGGQLAKL
jgi:NAD(P)-dependent dehydrogenase (short-subunit alcohol dehydrogenase family)